MSLVRVNRLRAGDQVALYGTRVEITGVPYRPTDYPMRDGWVRLPMLWEGRRCAPPEDGNREVEVDNR